MSLLSGEPHSVNVISPSRTRSPSTNVGTLNYVVPPATQFAVKCMLQMRGGNRVVNADGAAYPIDAVLYTTDLRISVDDLILPVIPTAMAAFRFVVTNVMFKYKTNGEFDHVELALSREAKV